MLLIISLQLSPPNQTTRKDAENPACQTRDWLRLSLLWMSVLRLTVFMTNGPWLLLIQFLLFLLFQPLITLVPIVSDILSGDYSGPLGNFPGKWETVPKVRLLLAYFIVYLPLTLKKKTRQDKTNAGRSPPPTRKIRSLYKMYMLRWFLRNKIYRWVFLNFLWMFPTKHCFEK